MGYMKYREFLLYHPCLQGTVKYPERLEIVLWGKYLPGNELGTAGKISHGPDRLLVGIIPIIGESLPILSCAQFG
jgi:hypothetical protein